MTISDGKVLVNSFKVYIWILILFTKDTLTPYTVDYFEKKYIDGLVQDCSNSIANAQELLQSCTKPSIYTCTFYVNPLY